MPSPLKELRRLSEKRRSVEEAEHAEYGRSAANERAFQSRLRLQQFLRGNAPVVAAYAALKPTAGPGLAGEFQVRCGEARDIAAGIASILHAKEISEVEARDAQPFRHLAAGIVAGAWRKGRTVDVDSVVEDMVPAIEAYADGNGYGGIDWSKTSDEASLFMTGVSVTLAISAAVGRYSFRRDEAELTRLLSDLVVEEAARVSDAAVGTGFGGSADRRSLRQTTSQALTEILVSIYERQAVEILRRMHGRGEDEKRAILAETDPVGRIVAELPSWSDVFLRQGLAAAGKPEEIDAGDNDSPEAPGNGPD